MNQTFLVVAGVEGDKMRTHESQLFPEIAGTKATDLLGSVIQKMLESIHRPRVPDPPAREVTSSS